MMASSTEERIKELAGEDEPTAGESIFKVAKRFAFKSVAWFGIYILGYYGFSIAWLLTPLLLTVFRQQWKKERDFRLSAARQAALTNEKAMIESRIKIEDLPSWVFFPDKVLYKTNCIHVKIVYNIDFFKFYFNCILYLNYLLGTCRMD